MGDVNCRFGHGLRCAALICSLYALLIYITALTIQMWWILRTEARQPFAVFMLAVGFGILVVLSSALIVGIAMMQLKLYVIWLVFMLLWYAPELALSLFVAIAVRNPGTVHGAGEIAFTCVRSSLNVVAILIVHRLVLRERRRARLKRLLLATGHSYTNASLSATTGSDRANPAINTVKRIEKEEILEECNNSSVLKSSLLSLTTFKDSPSTNKNPLQQTLSESGANALSKKLTLAHSLPQRPASSAGNLSPPAMAGAVSNDYDELHHISEGEEEDESKEGGQTSPQKQRTGGEIGGQKNITESGKTEFTKLSLTSTPSSKSGSSGPSSKKSKERSLSALKNKRSAPSPDYNDKRASAPSQMSGAASVGQLFIRREIPTTNLDDTTDEDSKHRLSPQIAMNGRERRSPPLPPPLPSAPAAKSKFVITTLAHDGQKPLAATNGHNKSRVAPIFEKRKRKKDDGGDYYYDDEFMRQWNCNFFALTPQTKASDAPRSSTVNKSGQNSSQSSSSGSSSVAAAAAKTQPTQLHRAASTDEAKDKNNVRLYNELFAYRPKSIRHTPQMQDIAQMKRRPSMHERQLSTKEYPTHKHPAADYDDHHALANKKEEQRLRTDHGYFAEIPYVTKHLATSRETRQFGGNHRQDIPFDTESTLHKSQLRNDQIDKNKIFSHDHRKEPTHSMEFLL